MQKHCLFALKYLKIKNNNVKIDHSISSNDDIVVEKQTAYVIAKTQGTTSINDSKYITKFDVLAGVDVQFGVMLTGTLVNVRKAIIFVLFLILMVKRKRECIVDLMTCE